MNKPVPLEHGKYYHIYNRGINGCDLFKETDNFLHFLRLYEEYIPLVADTYAWVLLRNHFHFMIRIKEVRNINYLSPLVKIPDRSIRPCQDDSNKGILFSKRKPVPEKQFGHLFNAYAKAFNKRYNRTGSLFERPFNRIEITDEYYLKSIICYIHNNPVHHGFVDQLDKYPWNSFTEVVTRQKIRFQCNEVIGWLFNDLDKFLHFHHKEHDVQGFKKLVIEKK